ncbi:hypothetical protein [Nocardia sp. NPDC020380]|uniref:hypothetical protein n=1 Tax=Nocardia sp. NPDC020380 TaxID=3364309 RepID=UPI0037BC8633
MVAKLVPVAFVFLAGALFARRGIISSETSKAFSEFAFRFLIPAFLMESLYIADLRRVFNLPALGAYAATAVVSAGVIAAVAQLQGITAERRPCESWRPARSIPPMWQSPSSPCCSVT